VTGRRGRRRRKLLDDLKERRGYSHLKENALDHPMWRARFGGGFGPVVRQSTQMKMNKEMRFWGADRIDLAQDRDKWWALVKPEMKFRFPYNPRSYLDQLIKDRLCKMTVLHAMCLTAVSLYCKMTVLHAVCLPAVSLYCKMTVLHAMCLTAVSLYCKMTVLHAMCLTAVSLYCKMTVLHAMCLPAVSLYCKMTVLHAVCLTAVSLYCKMTVLHAVCPTAVSLYCKMTVLHAVCPTAVSLYCKMTVLHAVCLPAVSLYFRNLIFVQIIDRNDFRSRILLLLHNTFSTVVFVF